MTPSPELRKLIDQLLAEGVLDRVETSRLEGRRLFSIKSKVTARCHTVTQIMNTVQLIRRIACHLCLAAVSVGVVPFAGAANVYNVDMAFTASQTYNRTGTYDWPDTPDKGSVTTADFIFDDNTEHIWKLNSGATVVLEQDSGVVGGRLFPGADGQPGILTFTSDSGTPGKISARNNDYAALRIGDYAGSVGHGTLNIQGGGHGGSRLDFLAIPNSRRLAECDGR